MTLEFVHCVRTLEVFIKAKVFEDLLVSDSRYDDLLFVRT